MSNWPWTRHPEKHHSAPPENAHRDAVAAREIDRLYTAEEAAILRCIRYVFQSFGQPDSLAWRHAVSQVQDLPGGSATLEVLIDCAHGMRLARQSVFLFANPRCENCAGRVSAHERQFMACIRHARRGDLNLAERHATLLCEGNDCTLFLACLAQLPTEHQANAMGGPAPQ